MTTADRKHSCLMGSISEISLMTERCSREQPARLGTEKVCLHYVIHYINRSVTNLSPQAQHYHGFLGEPGTTCWLSQDRRRGHVLKDISAMSVGRSLGGTTSYYH